MSRGEAFVGTVHVRFSFDREARADDGDSAQTEVLEQGK